MFSIFPAGDSEQHHPVPVRRQLQPHLHHHQETSQSSDLFHFALLVDTLYLNTYCHDFFVQNDIYMKLDQGIFSS